MFLGKIPRQRDRQTEHPESLPASGKPATRPGFDSPFPADQRVLRLHTDAAAKKDKFFQNFHNGEHDLLKDCVTRWAVRDTDWAGCRRTRRSISGGLITLHERTRRRFCARAPVAGTNTRQIGQVPKRTKSAAYLHSRFALTPNPQPFFPIAGTIFIFSSRPHFHNDHRRRGPVTYTVFPLPRIHTSPPVINHPPTLMISTNWSTPDSPGNNGWPRIISAVTQAADHMSMAVV